jgi:hypothetical protein
MSDVVMKDAPATKMAKAEGSDKKPRFEVKKVHTLMAAIRDLDG